MSPTDVNLCEDQKTVVQPDLQIVCDPSIITEERVVGAPDFVLEVISPSTGFKDYTIKMHKYQEAGVREYWIVDSMKKRLLIFYFAGEEVPQILTLDGKADLRIFDGEISIDLDALLPYCM
jgi:Uma2 family endonuclease